MRRLPHFATFVILSCLAGCGEGETDTIRIGIPTRVLTSDPRFASDAQSARIVRLLHRAPVRFDANLQPVPDLVRWEMLAPVHYRLTLVANAVFSNGRPVTAADVAATYRSVQDQAVASPHRLSIANISTFEVLDERRLDVRLHQPDRLFPGTLTIGVLAADQLTDGAVTIGAGNFELVHWSADRVQLARRSDRQMFEFAVTQDATVRVLKLIAGEIDIAQGNLPPELFNWAASRSALRAVQVPGSTFSYLGMNLEDPMLGNLLVRRALAHAIDRETIVRRVFFGTARLAGALLPPEHWAGNSTLTGIAYDPEKSRQLLAQAGLSARRLELEMKTSTDYFRVRVATILQQQLAEVGIDLKVRSYDWGTFYGDVVAGRFQLYGLSWVGLELPTIFRHAFHSASLPPGGANRGHFESEVIDHLIEQAESATAVVQQAELYRDVQSQLDRKLPIVPLWFEDQLVLQGAQVSGYTTDLQGSYTALQQTYKESAGSEN